MSGGSVPLSRLDRRLRILSASSFPRVLTGIWPKSLTPGSRTATTLEPSKLQLIPTQVVHNGVSASQLTLWPCGTTEMKSRRAFLSESMSAIVRSVKINEMKSNAAQNIGGFI
ncbi:hypothetical protein TorRG33x02_089900 [Trema orientale]|uniref:Uncharacterized protein n=1 Tax=Trema orientale TaxID=63057 RepID=A0A2P5FBE9_TREOI|nr:hypothetical protein TorRG33x02_089900 [Trema orientale]